MPTSRLIQFGVWLLFPALVTSHLRADQTLYRYECDVVPYDPSAGWEIFNPCEPPSSESVQNGRFRLMWPVAEDLANYSLTIAQPPVLPPSTLWVEWRFRSNHPLGEIFFSCDGRFFVKYGGNSEGTHLYGNAAISFSGDDFVTGLALNEFHTFRYESTDGVNYRIAANGIDYIELKENQPNGFHYLQLQGRGGCGSDQIPNMVNEWDFVRYGTIGTGEQLVSVSPPSGALGPSAYTSFTSFLVTFDQPNYVYVDAITVSVTGGIAPIVTATRRTDTHDEHTVEIVLDRALPPNELTTFTLTDGHQSTNIHYDFRPLPAAIPTAGTSGLIALVVALTLAAGLILRNRADVTAP